MQELFDHIARYVPLGDDQRNLLSRELKLHTVNKKEYLLKEGRLCNARYFVAKGCLRLYYVNDKGVEHILQFAIDGWWLTDYVSYGSRQPSQFFIQAVEASGVVVWEHGREEQLLAQVPQLERYFRLLQQRTAAAALQRARYMVDYSGEELYHHFRSSFPEFLQRVPQYMLASYLGFTPEFLSRIRAGKN